MAWTEHQLDAIEARGGSVIVSAAAGSADCDMCKSQYS